MEKVKIDENYLMSIMTFIKTCDDDFLHGVFDPKNAAQATKYLLSLKSTNKLADTSIVKAISEKLAFIANQIDAVNYSSYKKEAVLNLVSVSVTDYIIKFVQEKRITDPLLIARFVYIELSKVLYYDVSYIKQDKENKKIICDAKLDFEKEKYFLM